MKHKAVRLIRDIVALASIGTLAMFFISDIVLGQDVFFAHPFVVLAVACISIVLWHWCQDRQAA